MRIADIRTGSRHRKDLGDIAGLAASIAEIGLLHPIVVTPDGTLIAGARRIAACVSLGWTDIPVTVVDIPAIVRGEYAENTCRKDFTWSEAVSIARVIEERESESAKERQESTRFGSANLAPPSEAGKTRDKVAEAVGKKRTSLSKAEAIVDSQYDDLIERMDDTGKVTPAFQEMVKRKANEKPLPILPSGKYRVILADPPWAYGNTMPDYMGVQDDHYPTMSMSDLCALPIRTLAEDNAVLFLWVTSPILHDCFELIDAWGFAYKASFVWDKIKHVMGHYNSVRHEFLLVCVRGSCQPDVHKLFDSVVTEERTEHSCKPETFREIIDTIYPNGRRIELFAREKHEGWETYGNEV
jgi:N6-adenosine-specific RNA methylase IME4